MATTEKALRASIIAHGAQIAERGLGGETGCAIVNRRGAAEEFLVEQTP